MSDLRSAILAASCREEVVSAVRLIYADLQGRIALRQPVCQSSGRCCKFEEFGHRLYVTTMELAAFVKDLDEYPAMLARLCASNPVDHPGCIFQELKLCSVHAIRPFGCRIFFCDETATEWQREQYELFHARLKRLHEELDVPYYYMEWRQGLETIGGSAK
jgi:Fe-S-cluster containining protein